MKTPTLFQKLVRRSGEMTYTAPSPGRPPDPPLRLLRAAQLVQQHLRGGAVLDVGCWEGELARQLPPDLHRFYTGVDIAPAAPAVETARRLVPGANFAVVQSVSALPFSDGSFDVVVLTEIIEHVPVGSEGLLLAEAARVLKKHGSIILSTPVANLLNPLDPSWFFGHRHYSVNRLEEIARAQSLSVMDVEFTGGLFTVLDTNFFYFHKHVLHRPYSGMAWLKRQMLREHIPSARGVFASNLWCRLIRP
ncbi:MAG TPA: class I SAM-dependent methyltransferase [Candidatus Tumulicola sp.]|nr:class I SAM-dependent methyltransferase [Candidatus Tumulicola sp.]